MSLAAVANDDALLRQGMVALEQKRAGEAEHLAREVLARRAEHTGAARLLAIALLAQNRAQDALAPLEIAARGGNDPAIETQLARLLRSAGRVDEALAWLERATARQPPLAPAFHDLGIVLCSLRRFAEAEAALKRGLAMLPEVAELWVELGGVYLNRADPAQATTAFARALAIAPAHPRALHGFGTALLYVGDFARASERFRQVLQRDPNHLRARLDLAHCLLELGRFDEAVGGLRAMVKAAPQAYGRALQILVSSARGRLWLKPSSAEAFLGRPPATRGPDRRSPS